MAGLALSIDDYERIRGKPVASPLKNMFVEQCPTEERGIILQSRPATVDRGQTLGDGPAKAILREDGILSGNLFAVSNRRLYQNGTEIGLTSGNKATSIAGYANCLFTAAGGDLKTYDGASLSTVAFPDGQKIAKVITGGSRAIAIPTTGHAYYWTDPLGITFPALNFASAESQPDGTKDALFVDNMAVLFGGRTVEFHYGTGDSDAPFKPLVGREYGVGIRQTGACAKLTNGFAWVGHDNVIYLGPDQSPKRVSNAGLEEKIAASEDVSLWTFRIEGTEFLAVRIDAGTWVYSTVSGLWSQMTSNGYANWVPGCWADGVFGSAYDGRTLAFGNTWEDLGGPMERLFRAGLVINGGGVPINNLSLRCNPGQTTYTDPESPYYNPMVELRLSHDGGQTFEFFASEPMGIQGDYSAPVRWAGLGRFGPPGMLGEFRYTAPTDFRVSDVRANEAF